MMKQLEVLIHLRVVALVLELIQNLEHLSKINIFSVNRITVLYIKQA